MKYLAVSLATAFAVLIPVRAEGLTYVINWPSGLNLGEATLTSTQKKDPADDHSSSKAGGPWSFSLDLDASVPGFAIRDHYESRSDAGFCAAELQKSVAHGSKKSEEKITFDQHNHSASRESGHGGGKTEVEIPACARDPLTFLEFARRELAQGRMAPQQPVIFGSAYQVRMVFSGTQQISVGGKRMDADKIQASVKGPASDFTVDLYFARDAVRTPVMARIPLPLGAFTVELMP
ncbi:MAG TPA: DUF3108 domain-containing protein [Bryobacteraceae bacterium]|nr:DUF3108 domain-containing protein [Bryobacteraceae bacterium]